MSLQLSSHMGAREIYQFASPSRTLPRAAAEVNRSSALRGRFRPLWVAAGGLRFRSGSRHQRLVPGEKPLLASLGCGERSCAADAAGGGATTFSAPAGVGRPPGLTCLGGSARSSLTQKLAATPNPSESGSEPGNEGETRLCAPFLPGLSRAVYPS